MPAETTLEDLTKAELYQRAQKADIPGRSQMDRAELIVALANGTPSRPSKTEPSTTQRSIWSGAITFGLITIPVGLYTAIEDRDIAFRLLSGKDRSRVQYKRVSTKTGREVDWDDIVKGYEYENGKFVVFTQEELEQIPVESLRVVDIVQFVERSAIDPLYFDRSYYVAPDKTAVKAYKLFLDALAESDRVAIGKITLREKERLCTLRAKDGVLVLETMNWPDEIRVPAFAQLDQAPRISGEEKKMAQLLIFSSPASSTPDRFQDTYRQRLQEAIDAKIEGHEVEYAPPEPMSEKVVDLLDALRASVEANRARRSA